MVFGACNLELTMLRMSSQQLLAFPQAIVLSLKEKIRTVSPTAWLESAVIFYIIALPFNAFGFTIPFVGYLLKYTEVALLAIIVAAIYAYRQGALTIRKAQWLYGFLLLNAVAQLVSLLNARNPFEGFEVAFAVAQYSVVVFVLVNVVKTEALMRKLLVIMGIVSVLVISATYLQSVLAGLHKEDFQPGQNSSILGIDNAHYLAYFLILYGSGLAYLFITRRKTRKRRYLIILASLVWFNILILAAVKIAVIAALFFLVLLPLLLKGYRLKAFALLGIFLVVFVYHLFAVPIKNYYLIVAHPIRPYLQATTDPLRNSVFAIEDRVYEWRARRQLAALSKEVPIEASTSPEEIAMATPPSPTPMPSPVITESTSLPLPPRQEPLPPPPPPTPPPPSPSAPSVPFSVKREVSDEVKKELVDEYSKENRIWRRWTGSQKRDSFKIRQRGLAVAWLMGAESPFTGAGAGQTRPELFDEFTAKVRAKARTLDPSSWQNSIFVDEAILVNSADKGIFNIFGNAWAETGLPGLIAIVGILATVFFKGVQTLWRMRKVTGVYPIRILFPMFVAIILYHQTSYLWVHPWLWTIIALTYAAACIEEIPNYKSQIPNK